VLTTLSVSHLRPVPAATRHGLLLSLSFSVVAGFSQIKLADLDGVDDKGLQEGSGEIRLARPGRGSAAGLVLILFWPAALPYISPPEECAWTRTRERIGPTLFFCLRFVSLSLHFAGRAVAASGKETRVMD
jgi:hypothetical protein